MGPLGLFLIRVVVWATEQLSRKRQRPGDYVVAGAAHLALGGVTFVGRVVDRLPSFGPFERPAIPVTAPPASPR